ncbi:unnamed protein product [Cunninghamella blakesleeana]
MNSNLFIDMNSNNNNNHNNMNNSLFLNQETIANFLFGASTTAASSTISSALPTPTINATSTMDEWLTDDLNQSTTAGLLSTMMPDFFKQIQHHDNNDNSNNDHTNLMLDYIHSHPSPPLTNSSPSLQQSTSPTLMASSSPSSISSGSMSDHPSSLSSPNGISSSHVIMNHSSSMNKNNNNNTNNGLAPLFPDITPKKPGYRAIAPAKKQLIPIMPKTASIQQQQNQSSYSNNNNNNNQPLLSHPHFIGNGSSSLVSSPSFSKRKHFDEKEQDEITLKRQKNTDAARRSRLKKLMKMETLEKRVVELETDNSKLTTRIAVLESEKSGLESKDKSLEERIRTLEAQLAEAHKALTGRQ